MGVYLMGVHPIRRMPYRRASHWVCTSLSVHLIGVYLMGVVVLRLSDFSIWDFWKKSALFTFVSDDPWDESRCPQMPILPFLAKLLLQHLLFIPHPQS
jgi:hypothetical protein